MRIRKTLLLIAIAAAAANAVAADDAPTPARLGVGSGGFFKSGLLLQGWFQGDHSDGDTTTTFRVRRAEISAKGEIVPGLVGYGVMFDPAKVLEFQDKQPVSAVSAFQDFWLTVPSTYVDVAFGQVKIPVSLEGYGSSSKLLFPERALVSREYGDKRDIGLRLTKTFRRFGYYAGVFNGTGPNALDANDEKDVTLRLEGYPVEGLVVAGVVYATIGGRTTNAKDRYEGDVRFQHGPLLLQAEYIRAHDIDKSAQSTDSQGFYGAVAWTFVDVLQPCVRVGYLDPNVHANVDPAASGGKDEVWHFDAGLNYYLRQNEAKLQLAYSRFQYGSKSAVNEVILAGQVSF